MTTNLTFKLSIGNLIHFKLIHTHLSEYGGRAKEWLLGSMASKLATTILKLNHLVSLVAYSFSSHCCVSK